MAAAPAPAAELFKLLADIPPGAWVALSHDQKRVVAYDAEMREAVRKAHDAGEPNPGVIRVPVISVTLAL